MVQGIPYDSPRRPGPVRGDHGAHARGVLCHVGGNCGRGRAVPALSTPIARRCCASFAIIAGPPTTRRHDEYEGLTITPVGIDAAHLPDLPARSRPRANATACWNWARSTATAMPRSRCIAPTGTIGLVMDCDTTGVEPDFALVKFKKLAGGGYFKIINASIPPALARLGYTPRQIEDIVRYCRGAGTLQGCPHINPASLKAKGFTDDVLQRHRGSAARRLSSSPLSSIAGRWAMSSARASSASPRSNSMLPASTCWRRLGFTREQIAEANDYVCGTMTIEGAPHLKAEHYPVFDCANKCGKLGQALSVGRVAHSHDGGRPAVYLAGRSPRRSTCRTRRPSKTSSKRTCSAGN